MRNVIEMALNCFFFAAKLQKSPSSWGLCSHASSVIRLSCISLFSTWPELNNFCAKKFTFSSSLLSLSKILVACLIAFIPADRFFKRLYGLDHGHQDNILSRWPWLLSRLSRWPWLDTKRANKRCRLYTALFRT